MKLDSTTIRKINQYLSYLDCSLELVNSLVQKGIFDMQKGREFKGSPLLYDETLQILKEITKIVETIEENDRNLDPEKTELESVDKHFEDHPITDYVDACVDYIKGNKNEEVVYKIKKAVNDLVGETKEGENEEHTTTVSDENYISKVTMNSKGVCFKIKPFTESSFVDQIINILLFSKEENENGYVKSFREGLVNAIETLKNRPGRSEFFVTVNGELKRGSLSVSDSHITVVIDGVYFEFDRNTLEADCGICDTECSYECTDKESDHGVTCPDCVDCDCYYDGEDEEPEKVSIYEVVSDLAAEYSSAINEAMDDIKQHINRKIDKGLNEQDYDLIRFYLLNLPFSNKAEVESSSNVELVQVWRSMYHI